MATSPNYGWSEPDDTSFVKQGAAAMRTLGNAIDTTVKSIDTRVTTAESNITTLQTAVNALINPFLLMGA